jgi:hypothetical protein
MGWWFTATNLRRSRLGGALVAGRTVAAGTGGMMESAPSFGAVSGEDGRWAWEEAGLLLRRAILEPVGEAAS